MSGLVELGAAPCLDEIDEGLVHVALERLDPLDVLRLLRQERIERVLVLAGGIDAALHADLGDHLVAGRTWR